MPMDLPPRERAMLRRRLRPKGSSRVPLALPKVFG
jgi:hypothetical protein